MAPRPKKGIAAFLAALACLAGPATAAGASETPAPPTCAEGPARAGDAILGTPCADRIVVPAAVEYVNAGGGDDVIVATVITAATPPCEGTCLGVRSPVYEGGEGNDVVFGERGNDTIRGNGGDDRLFGGIGDDLLQGGPGNDTLVGGFGADSIDGQGGSDYVRGDGTIDRIFDTGGAGSDTLSYATAATPGFSPSIDTGADNFHADENSERGVYLDLSAAHPKFNGGNGAAADGGGSDEVEIGVFETVVGSPFSDYIVGGEGGETIYGGGGADVLEGRGGGDQLFGGAEGDDLDGGEGSDSADGGPGSNRCQSIAAATACPANATKAVSLRGSGQVSVGTMVPAGVPLPRGIYLLGTAGGDEVTASYGAGVLTFTLAAGSFDTQSDESGCDVSGATASCPVGSLDSVDLAGLGGADELSALGFPQQVGVIVLGGEGGDEAIGGDGSEDVLVDGRGASKDVLAAGGRDDALIHNGGPDALLGGEGNDLFLSTSACDGETISGEEGIDNASWARLEDAAEQTEGRGVDAHLGAPGIVGRFGDPGCSGRTNDALLGIEDLEGSDGADTLVGDGGPNQLLGHAGPDQYLAGFGADIVLANSKDSDPLINCGPDADSAVIDIPTATYADAAPIECESVREGAPEDFRTATELPPPPLLSPPPPPADTRPPRTRIAKRPAKLLSTIGRHRRVAFRFTASEPNSSFRCKLDAKPYRPCTSPRVYNLPLGRHAVRIFAVDAAGNADRTPALLRFRIRQVRPR